MNAKYCNIQELTKVQEILCLALSSAPDDERVPKFVKLFEPSIEDQLYNEAIVDEVDSHIAHLMKISGIEISGRWLESYHKTKNRIDILLNELDNVSSTLSNHNISIVALKNAGIARGIYKQSACSPMGDIDLLVSISDFRSAHDILTLELNYNFKFRSKYEIEDVEIAFKHGGTEYYKDVDGEKIWLELQWRPIAGRWIQPLNEPNGDDLIKRSIRIDGSSAMILSPTDNLIQVSLHTAKHSFVRAPGFRLHSDVDRIVRYTNIDWKEFIILVNSLKVRTAVYFSLGIATYLLQSPIPYKVIESLKPNFLRGNIIRYFISNAGVFNQKKRKFSKIGYILFNVALYDSISLLFNAIIPNPYEIKQKYDVKYFYLMPYYYIVRLKDLILNREKL